MKYRILILPVVLSLLIFYTHLGVTRAFPEEASLSWALSLGIFIIMVGSQIIGRVLTRYENTWPIRIVIWTGSVVMGFWATYIILSLFIDLLYCALLIVQLLLRSPLPVDSLQVQTFVMNAYRGLLVFCVGFSVLGLLQAAKGPRITRISIPGAPAALNGLKIAQISDLHIGATIHRDYVSNVVNLTLGVAPDIIVITGDIADGKPDDLRAYAEPLGQLSAPLGTYFITGNHEYYSGALEWIAHAKALGMIPLINENRIVTYRDVKVMVAGVTDITAHQFLPEHRSDPHKAAASPEPVAFKLLLAHQPESHFEAEKAGFDLQLSGHTHAGQFFPFNLLVKLAKRYYRGLSRYKSMWLYVNAGTGYWGAVNRFGVPAEITLITLHA